MSSIFRKARAGYKNEEILYLLRSGSMEVDARDATSGRYLLHEAAAYGNDSLIDSLVTEFAADLHQKTYLGGDTPLHLAVSSDSKSTVSLLLRYGADPNVQNRYMCTPLHYACSKDVALKLHENDGSALTKNSSNETPLETSRRRLSRVSINLSKESCEIIDALKWIEEEQKNRMTTAQLQLCSEEKLARLEALTLRKAAEKEEKAVLSKQQTLSDYVSYRNR
uniref:Ankyrin repeat protein n=2 Tax=Leptocylindrus danicus TaxID=163516 RepID=A0A7S2PDT2_9STRA|mmetsp:Transcript_2968/g.4258  ORF Transcript_2968/g.4258 Transcript_2968/m.4258 type:complete len:223 (+) Transcript_2968:130-798(+)|eukprot:CAMPEP_0116041194 /NCGR_PEP_ID=MMETSP0321-20121206/24872_1 /TAXON_ID=163516 /ORGANISM="Leptocylindrus danicus var. danicus, Strain B650" /LENGTH=222 /DNA_ID=CAMNT_0003521279 /DNA_START=91 /DNA_END=759 /DNA_ORIENTATION=-